MRIIWLIIGVCIISEVQSQTFIKRTYYDDLHEMPKEVISLSKQDSSLHGPFLSYYTSGSLQAEGYYLNNLSDSTWIFYFENGQKKAEGKYSQGKQTGKWRYYFERGNLRAEGIMKEDTKHGAWTFYFENGSEKSSGVYYKDQKEGIWNYFYEDGIVKAQAFYERGTGNYKEFYPSGAVKNEGKNIEEKSVGRWRYYYESGELEAEGEYFGGLRNGLWKYYHKNKTVAAEGRFLDGEKSGIWKYYYPDGSISSEGQMKQDKQEGFWKLYYPTGDLKGEGSYDQGSGTYTEYYTNGKQKSSGRIKDGLKEGTWTYFSEEGLEEGKAEFKNGVGEYKGFYPDGTLRMEGTIRDDKRVGEWTLYYPDGRVAGVYKPIYENEKPIFRTKDLKDPNEKGSDKPEYKFRNKKIRYFNPSINEYRGVIFGTNPLWMPFGSLPLAAEYYIQERIGYELEVTVIRRPFFSTNENVLLDDLYSRGSKIEIRQKFYHPDTPMGLLYFGHEVIGEIQQHYVNVIDNQGNESSLNASEVNYGYGLFIGTRWMERPGDNGFSVDFRIGLGLGRRHIANNYESTPSNNDLFSELNRDEFYLPIIFSINLGYGFPKRRTTSTF
ncbi:MAG: membrane-binding protein [Cyclobacteriaceae bacterium]